VAHRESAHLWISTTIIADRYAPARRAKWSPLFGDPPHSHQRIGAELNAECVIAGLKGLKNNPVALYFTEKAATVVSYAAAGDSYMKKNSEVQIDRN